MSNNNDIFTVDTVSSAIVTESKQKEEEDLSECDVGDEEPEITTVVSEKSKIVQTQNNQNPAKNNRSLKRKLVCCFFLNYLFIN